MKVGTQFTGSVPAHGSQRWFTHSWKPADHVVWTVVPITPAPGQAQIEWEVAAQRAAADKVTYWITVRNLSAAAADVEGRFAILS